MKLLSVIAYDIAKVQKNLVCLEETVLSAKTGQATKHILAYELLFFKLTLALALSRTLIREEPVQGECGRGVVCTSTLVVVSSQVWSSSSLIHSSLCICVCMYVCMYIIYVCMYVCVCLYVCIYVCLYVYIYIYMYVFVCVCM